jgi:hypothetical protein
MHDTKPEARACESGGGMRAQPGFELGKAHINVMTSSTCVDVGYAPSGSAARMAPARLLARVSAFFVFAGPAYSSRRQPAKHRAAHVSETCGLFKWFDKWVR